MFCRKMVVNAVHSFRKSLRWAVKGVFCCFRQERNFRIHLVASIYSLTLGIWIGLTRLEWAVLGLTIGLVLALELVNTAIEAAVNFTSAQRHPLAKLAKDTAAGAVLIAALTSIGVGISLFWKPNRLLLLVQYLISSSWICVLLFILLFISVRFIFISFDG